MLLSIAPATFFAQRSSNTPQYLTTGAYNALPVVYNVNEDIASKNIPENPIKWGMDVAWDWDVNIIRGTNFLGKEVMKIGRVSFQATDIVNEDLILSANQQAALQNRLNLIARTGVKDIALNHDNGQWSDPEKGPTYKANYYGKPVNWYRVIKATVLYVKKKGFNVVTISPFNEPDYKGWADPEKGLKEGWTDQGTVTHFKEIARLLSEDTDLAEIRISAGNTLDCDKALIWYNGVKPYVTEGNTHQLAGTLNSYANFWQTVRNDGYIATADELHNAMEAFVGIHYGMQQGIWWGWEAVCRGEFCKSAYYGKEIGYNENRDAWTAATVYKRENGRIDAFLGSSERQAYTSSYDIVSLDRPVYYDTYGPVYSYSMEIPGGTGYQIGQTNAERIINILYGEDIPVEELDTNTVYTIMNLNSMKAIGYLNSSSAEATQLVQREYDASIAAAHQRWKLERVGDRVGGDFSYFRIRSNRSATKTHMIDIRDGNLSPGGLAIGFPGDGGAYEQFSFEYAGNGSFYIRSRQSGLYLEVANGGMSNNVIIQQGEFKGGNYQKWRLIPYRSPMELTPPVAPTGLKAENMPAAVKLSWTRSSSDDAVAYEILRSRNDQWDVIGRMVTETEFIDNDVMPDITYTYKVKTIDKARNRSEASSIVEGKATQNKALVAYLDFDENTYDETDNINDAVTSGTITYNTENKKKGTASIRLNGTDAYIKLPVALFSQKTMTIATWAFINTTKSWTRLFDFGNNTNHYMFFTPSNGGESRFVMKNGGDEQILSANKLSTGWHHVSITIGDSEVALYIDGEKTATSTTMTIRPNDIQPKLNYIGRSQFANDPLFNGYIDDFRIYNYALSAEDVVKLYNGEEPTNIRGVSENCTPSRYPNNAGEVFDLSGKRYQTPHKGINIINGKKINF